MWPSGDRPVFAAKPEKRPLVQLPANLGFRPIADIRRPKVRRLGERLIPLMPLTLWRICTKGGKGRLHTLMFSGGREGQKSMDQLQTKGFPLIGVIFLALGVFEFLQGDDWVVWIILGILFGGLGAVSRRKDKQP
jgi:hypothetical protein